MKRQTYRSKFFGAQFQINKENLLADLKKVLMVIFRKIKKYNKLIEQNP